MREKLLEKMRAADEERKKRRKEENIKRLHATLKPFGFVMREELKAGILIRRSTKHLCILVPVLLCNLISTSFLVIEKAFFGAI